MEDKDETATLLQSVPGGSDLLNWFFEGKPNFGDAELVAIHLDRANPSSLVVHVPSRSGSAMVTLHLGDWIDIRIQGFSHQNVIGGLTLRRAGDREIKPWESGVGCVPGTVTIELEPIFGAYGIIRATLMSVSIEIVQ